MRYLIFAGTFVALAGSANAQAIRMDKLTGNTVFQAIQCDVGRFGKYAVQHGVDPGLQAHVTYEWDEEHSQAVTASAGITVVKWIVDGPSVKASKTWTQTDKHKLDGYFNINEGNEGACGAKGLPRVDVGIYACLIDSLTPIKAGTTTGCDKDRVAAGKLNANGSITWTFFKAGVEGDFDVKISYSMHVDAPSERPEKKKKEVAAR